MSTRSKRDRENKDNLEQEEQEEQEEEQDDAVEIEVHAQPTRRPRAVDDGSGESFSGIQLTFDEPLLDDLNVDSLLRDFNQPSDDEEEEEGGPSDSTSSDSTIKLLHPERANIDFMSQLKEARRKRNPKSENRPLDAIADSISTMISQMNSALHRDKEAIAAGKPALHVVSMAPTIIAELNKPKLYDIYVECDILSVLKNWLDPLPDGSLLPPDLQDQLLSIILEMPVSLEILQSSKIGFTIYFYSKLNILNRPTRKLANKIIQKWIPVIQH